MLRMEESEDTRTNKSNICQESSRQRSNKCDNLSELLLIHLAKCLTVCCFISGLLPS